MKIIYNDGHVGECPEEEELEVLRHSAAHIMAQAVKRLYPQAHFAYGPATEKGFHYDIDLGDVKLTDEDLPAIEAEMQKIVKENLPFKVYPLPREEAVKLMQERGEIYKVEHIADLAEDAVITFYQQGDYIDMCVGIKIEKACLLPCILSKYLQDTILIFINNEYSFRFFTGSMK